MNGYTEVDSTTAMEELVNAANGFHDSMTKEVQVENLGFVYEGGAMQMSHQLNVRVLIQSQFEPHAFEMVFYKVSQLLLSGHGEHWSGYGDVVSPDRPSESHKVTLDLGGDTKITAERLYWRSCPEWVGPRIRFSGPVPSPEAVPAKILEDRWRQCSVCCDAWEENVLQVFSYCPSCWALTELDGQGPYVQAAPPAPRKSAGKEL